MRGESNGVIHLRLYVAGHSELSERATVNARALCDELGDGCELEIVDVIARPEIAAEDGVVTTPTLVRRTPSPERRLIGDLSDRTLIAQRLGLASAS